MIFVFDISTPVGATASSKKKTVLKVARGTTYKFEVLFPPGPSGLLHLQVCDALHQVWPTNPDANFSGDGETISFEDEFLIDEPPYELQAFTWNEDDTYAHGLTIRIGIKALSGTYYLSAEELARAAVG